MCQSEKEHAYGSLVRDHVSVHLGLNVSSSTLCNCGCVVDVLCYGSNLSSINPRHACAVS